MNLRRTYSIIYRYGCLLRGSPDRLIGLYIWMTIDMILWGFISKYLHSIAAAQFTLVTAFLGAVVLSNFFSRVMLNMNMTFFEDMWARNFLSIFASPMRISEYLGGLIICGLITSTLGLVVIFGMAWAMFDYSPLVYGTTIAPALLILYLTGIALGILGCGIVLARGPSSEWFIWPIPAIITPFTGVYYPISTLPEWMQAVATVLPPAYVFESLRAVLAGKEASLSSLMTGTALALVYIALASWFFLSIYRKALRTGLIARYSAENAN